MSDQNFREIQLSGKQLVFLFMTSVVVVVAVFLLGVSVGRGVRVNADAPEGVDQVASVEPPADLPPPTELVAGDREYHDSLYDAATPPPEPVADEPDDAAARDEAVDAPQPEPPAPTPAAEPPPAPEPPPAAAAVEGWLVQVGAFRSRQNADRQASDLVEKGYAAAVTRTEAGGLFRVRVGPFAERSEADRTAARLRSEEGIQSSISR